MVLTTEAKIMPPQLSRIFKLSWCGVWAPAPEPRLSVATTPRRTSPFQGTVGEGPESALTSRWLGDQRMRRIAPKWAFAVSC